MRGGHTSETLLVVSAIAKPSYSLLTRFIFVGCKISSHTHTESHCSGLHLSRGPFPGRAIISEEFTGPLAAVSHALYACAPCCANDPDPLVVNH